MTSVVKTTKTKIRKKAVRILTEYMNVLKKIRLFEGIAEGEIAQALKCLGAEVRAVKKDEIILLAGQRPTHIGAVLEGRLYVAREDIEGNRSLVAAISPVEMFAEALCCAGVEESPVTVVADLPSKALLLDFGRIITTCGNSCGFHNLIIKNMMGLLAQKNLQLQSRMEIVGLKSVRQKVLKYLETLSARQGKTVVTPFNREELADFLCVERSALSHELSRMKADGLIDYHKNRFSLL